MAMNAVRRNVFSGAQGGQHKRNREPRTPLSPPRRTSSREDGLSLRGPRPGGASTHPLSRWLRWKVAPAPGQHIHKVQTFAVRTKRFGDVPSYQSLGFWAQAVYLLVLRGRRVTILPAKGHLLHTASRDPQWTQGSRDPRAGSTQPHAENSGIAARLGTATSPSPSPGRSAPRGSRARARPQGAGCRWPGLAGRGGGAGSRGVGAAPRELRPCAPPSPPSGSTGLAPPPRCSPRRGH